MTILNNLTPLQRGITYIAIGTLVLFDILNWLSPTIHFIIILASLSLIVYGVMLTEIWKHTAGLTKIWEKFRRTPK